MSSQVAVITGGTRGIGLGIAGALIRRKASVAITYSSDERAAEAARDHLTALIDANQKILILKGDAGDEHTTTAHFHHVTAELGAVSVLVNNAGRVVRGALEKISMQEWNETIRVNLTSAFHWISLVVPGMKKAGFGRIVNISSIAARGGGVVGPHYAASKAGMLGLTRYAARELGSAGITVNAIAPAFIEDASIFTTWTREQKDELKKKICVPRLGLVKDVVRAFDYLLDSPYVTGVALDVNGGAFMI